YYRQQPVWKPCERTYQCTTVQVPLDYSAPDGERIELAVIRLKAKNQSQRLGSLVVNPGGPGGSGYDMVKDSEGELLTAPVAERYDLVGFDPRGVGRSEKIACLNDADNDRMSQIDGSPDTAEERAKLDEWQGKYVAACEKNSGDLLPHVGTRNAARDMDVLRAVLGDEKLNYLGYSYGTYLGAVYADLFPTRTGRLVLDAAVDPAVDAAASNEQQAMGFEKAFTAFLGDCVKQADCPYKGRTVDQARSAVITLINKAEAKPLPTDEARVVTGTVVTLGIAFTLYDKEAWEYLRVGLTEAERTGTGNVLLALVDAMNGRGDDGRWDGSSDALTAVNCADAPLAVDDAQIQAKIAEYKKTAPVFGPVMAWGGKACVNWPASPAADRPGAFTVEGAAPALIIGGSRDPATPVEWSHGLGRAYQGSVVLVRDGDGHGSYGDNACVNRAVEAYLTAGTLPKTGVVCR
ncbi:MAG TPA: alpha/beta hydrolase, partial [Yinghuangia sp.]|nr:alpha/beta hydrolase [Yinghuangia sp.]